MRQRHMKPSHAKMTEHDDFVDESQRGDETMIAKDVQSREDDVAPLLSDKSKTKTRLPHKSYTGRRRVLTSILISIVLAVGIIGKFKFAQDHSVQHRRIATVDVLLHSSQFPQYNRY